MNKLLSDEYYKIAENLEINKLKNQRILVTGASGLIGSYFINLLLFLNQEYNLNIEIFAMSRKKENLLKAFPKSNLYIIEQDLNNPFKLSFIPNYIIHAASNAHPLVYSTDPVGTMKTNLIGTINLLESIKESDCKFLYISSGEVYGNNANHPFTENDCGSVDSKLVRSCYPEAKRAAETLCMAYSEQYKINVNIARLCFIYGATITDTNSRADAQFLRNAINGENIIMKSEGQQRRTYCYVADCVSGLLTILLNGKNQETYNIANPNSVVSLKEYAQTLADIAGVKLVFELPDTIEKKGYSKPSDSILSSDKLQQLGWYALYDIKEGLKHTFYLKKENFTEYINV